MGVKYVSIKEACTLTGKSPRTIRYAISNGKLQSRKVKGARLIALSSLEKLYEITTTEGTTESAVEDTVRPDNRDGEIYQLEQRVKDLKAQLEQKDKDLEIRAEELARKDRLLQEQHDLNRSLQEKIPMLMPPEEERKKSFWTRIFGRN